MCDTTVDVIKNNVYHVVNTDNAFSETKNVARSCEKKEQVLKRIPKA
jgi:hypothetical protein